jgi:CRP-like cAMP-binding protein
MPFDDTMFLRKNVDILSFFTDEQLRKVTAVIERDTYKKGQTVVFQGEMTNNFYILKRGKAVVEVRNPKDKSKSNVAELKPGDFFGEVSLLESTAATATIKATEDDTEILTIPHDSFQTLCKMSPQLELALRERINVRRKVLLDALNQP